MMIKVSSPGGFAARINTFGAELSSLTDSAGRELLWHGDPAVWSGRAPILFPIVGRLRDQQYMYDGRSYHLPKHGFARTMDWALTALEPNSAEFELRPTDDTRLHYPFEFLVKVAFESGSHHFDVRAEVWNIGEHAMPASFGFHPAFRWPLLEASSRDDHVVVLERNEDPTVYRIGQNGLIQSPDEQPVRGCTLILSDDLFLRDAVILDGLKSQSLQYGAKRHEKVQLDFIGLPQLALWSKPQAGFVCIEPWRGFDDPEHFKGDIFNKPGIIALEPSQSWTCRMTMSVRGPS